MLNVTDSIAKIQDPQLKDNLIKEICKSFDPESPASLTQRATPLPSYDRKTSAAYECTGLTTANIDVGLTLKQVGAEVVIDKVSLDSTLVCVCVCMCVCIGPQVVM